MISPDLEWIVPNCQGNFFLSPLIKSKEVVFVSANEEEPKVFCEKDVSSQMPQFIHSAAREAKRFNALNINVVHVQSHDK